MPELINLLPEVLAMVLVLLPFRDLLSVMETDEATRAAAAGERNRRESRPLNLSRLPRVGMTNTTVVNGLRAAAASIVHHGQISTIGGRSPGLEQIEDSECAGLAYLWAQVRNAVSVVHVDLHRTCTYFGTSATPFMMLNKGVY